MAAKLAACLPSSDYLPSQPYIGGYGRCGFDDDEDGDDDHIHPGTGGCRVRQILWDLMFMSTAR